MKIYALKDNKTGLYYKRADGRGAGGTWVSLNEASIWTSKVGAISARTYAERHEKFLANRRGQHFESDFVIEELPVGYPEVTLVDNGDDWEGLYLNGKLVDQSHKILLEDLCRELKIRFMLRFVNKEWLNDRDSLPEDLSEVQYAQ